MKISDMTNFLTMFGRCFIDKSPGQSTYTLKKHVFVKSLNFKAKKSWVKRIPLYSFPSPRNRVRVQGCVFPQDFSKPDMTNFLTNIRKEVKNAKFGV